MVLCEAWQCFDEVKRGMNGTKGIQQLVEPDKFRREVPIESIDGARRIFEKFIPAKSKTSAKFRNRNDGIILYYYSF